jgi:hypothetical protein
VCLRSLEAYLGGLLHRLLSVGVLLHHSVLTSAISPSGNSMERTFYASCMATADISQPSKPAFYKLSARIRARTLKTNLSRLGHSTATTRPYTTQLYNGTAARRTAAWYVGR